jgi:hypothetical protein
MQDALAWFLHQQAERTLLRPGDHHTLSRL